ncbi:UNVERIFIED_CONTAM: hypothetical protein FKN15_013881 [Acipenser sinensis]
MLYKISHDGDLRGYVNFSLAYAPLDYTDTHNSTTCRYRAFLSASGDSTLFSWRLLAMRLGFMVMFEHVVLTVQCLIDWLVPDVPLSVEMRLKQEQHISRNLQGEEPWIPTQPRPPPLQSSPASLRLVPHPLLLDTLSVSLDLPSLDLEPRSRQDRAQFSTWSPAPLLPDTKTSLRCSQTSRTLPLVTTSLPLADRTSLHWVPAADLCPLLQPPVPRLSCRSPLTNRWGPSSPVRGPYLADPGRGPIHPRVRPWKRAKIDIYGLEGGWLCFRGGGGRLVACVL